MSLLDLVTLLLACLGAVLGVANTWHAYRRDRVRLRVTPHPYFEGGEPPGLAIVVVNVGDIPATIDQVAIELRQPRGHWFYFAPRFLGEEKLPCRLEPRAKLTALVPRGTEQEIALREAGRVVVLTSCGRVFGGSGRWFRRQVKQLRAAR